MQLGFNLESDLMTDNFHSKSKHQGSYSLRRPDPSATMWIKIYVPQGGPFLQGFMIMPLLLPVFSHSYNGPSVRWGISKKRPTIHDVNLLAPILQKIFVTSVR